MTGIEVAGGLVGSVVLGAGFGVGWGFGNVVGHWLGTKSVLALETHALPAGLTLSRQLKEAARAAAREWECDNSFADQLSRVFSMAG